MAARIEFSRNADTRHGQLLRVEQGRYGDGRWQVQKQLNGDQADDGLNFGRAPADGNVPGVADSGGYSLRADRVRLPPLHG
ncbi:hypothetical protein EYR05_13325 [Xanthomonas oryzae pv. oryzae]|nr:hypothetical protein EYR05_13325 [Xanthomonas oryzae pv. oryzae]